MKFYAIEDRLLDAVNDYSTKVRVQVAFDFTGAGVFVAIPECDILELEVVSLKEVSGGTITFGTLVVNNDMGSYCPRLFDDYRPDYNKYNGVAQADGMGNLRPGRKVEISYTTGRDIPFVKRFLLYVNDKGFQQTATGYKGRVCSVGLIDLAARLKKANTQKDWLNPEVLVHSVICDKEFPESSLVHQIAARGGLGVTDIDCSTITEYMPYVRLARSVWAELSEMALVYNAHLETAMEKPLVFVNSEDEIQYQFDSSNVTHIKMYDLREQYRNTLRFRWTRYREFVDVQLWKYADPPVLYNDNLEPQFPFVLDGEKRNIEKTGYEERYTVVNEEGKKLPVVYADHVDSVQVFAANMVTVGPPLQVQEYDVTTYRNRVCLFLETLTNTILLSATISGDAIAGEANFSLYIHNEDDVATHGVVIKNFTSSYLSETLREGVPYYKFYATALLSKLRRKRKGFFLKTNRALFHARVGASVRVDLADGMVSERAEIITMELRYKARKAFVASFILEEE